jgi:hypothetical protein
MSLRTYNKSQLAILCTVKDELKYYLGEEINHDPEGDTEALTELETRLANWLTVGGGGAWLRSLPEVSKELTPTTNQK